MLEMDMRNLSNAIPLVDKEAEEWIQIPHRAPETPSEDELVYFYKICAIVLSLPTPVFIFIIYVGHPSFPRPPSPLRKSLALFRSTLTMIHTIDFRKHVRH